MKRNHGKFLIVAAIPLIVAASPTLAFTCNPNVPPTWDPSVSVPRTATIGWGTVIGKNVTISSYVKIGTCGDIGTDGNGGSISSRATLDNNVTMSNGSGIGGSASIGAGSTIDGSKVNSHADIGPGSTITGGAVGSYSKVGAGATITGSKIDQYVRTGISPTVTGGAYLGYSSDYGDNVTVDNSRVNRDARVDSGSVSPTSITNGAYIGASAHVCASVDGMYIAAHTQYGCQ